MFSKENPNLKLQPIDNNLCHSRPSRKCGLTFWLRIRCRSLMCQMQSRCFCRPHFELALDRCAARGTDAFVAQLARCHHCRTHAEGGPGGPANPRRLIDTRTTVGCTEGAALHDVYTLCQRKAQEHVDDTAEHDNSLS